MGVRLGVAPSLLSRYSRAILIDLIFNASLGLAFAVCARDRIRADGAFAAPSFVVVLLFTGLLLLPMTFYFYVWHPAWTWMYLLDPGRLPTLAVVPLVVMHGAVLIGGWYAGARLIRAGKSRAAAYAVAGLTGVVLLATIVTWRRIGWVGTYEEFRDARALPIMEVKLGYVMAAMIIGMAVAIGSVAIELVRDSRRVRSR
jgi:hypothetical protein